MNITIEQEARLLLNNEVRVTSAQSQFHGQVGIVKQVMHDGRTLDVKLSNGKFVFLDVTLVSEIQERQHGEPTKSLGPIQNHLVKDTI